MLEEQIGPEWVQTNPDAEPERSASYFSDRGLLLHALFTLQYGAGRDNIKTTMGYAHARENALHRSSRGWANL